MWWFIENEQGQPCFYDQSTKDLFLREKGYPMHEFESASESITGHEEMLDWLREQNGKFTHFLRDAVKQKYPDSEFTVLFFTPSVIDEDRVPEMMSIVNFPQEHWRYPNLDFFMIEDYDYLINDEMDKHLETLTFAQEYLDYPEDKIHYFSGFVLNSDYSHVWNNIEQAINNGFNQGFKETYIWAYAQVKRDGWKPTDIIYANKPSGVYNGTHYVSLSCDDADFIKYTLDGTEPSHTNGKTYSKPIYINSTKLLKAVAVKNEEAQNVVEFKYTMPDIKIPTKVSVDGNIDEWREIISISRGTGTIDSLYSVLNSEKLYILVKGNELNSANNFYLDTDNDSTTGYKLWCWKDSGADYMIEENIVKKYVGTGNDWSWVEVGIAELIKSDSVIEASVELTLLDLNNSTKINIGYSRDYSDFVPGVGKKMAQSSFKIYNDEDILANLEYLTLPIESSKTVNAKISVDGGNKETLREYYVEAFCSWDNETWYSKGGKILTIPEGEQKRDTDLEYSIFLHGDLYTKVIVYDRKGGTILGEYIKAETDDVGVGFVEKYDWYKFSETLEADITVEGYISDIGGYAGETQDEVYAITKRSDEEVWRQYLLNEEEWVETGIVYSVDPIANGEIQNLSQHSLHIIEGDYSINSFGLPSIKDIRQRIKRTSY